MLLPPVPVTPAVLSKLDDLAARADELYLTLTEQEALDARLGYVRDWLARARAAIEAKAEWQVPAELPARTLPARDLASVPLAAHPVHAHARRAPMHPSPHPPPPLRGPP